MSKSNSKTLEQLCSSNNGKLTIDGANISETDIPTANGIIHVIDSVIPPSELSVLEILESDPKFKTTVSLIKLTGLDLPTASSTFTVFAPTDEAFALGLAVGRQARLQLLLVIDVVLQYVLRHLLL